MYSYDDAGHRLSRHLDYADGVDADITTSWQYEQDSEETVLRSEIENQSGLDGYEYDIQGNLTYLPGWAKDCEGDEALDLTRQYEWDSSGHLIAVKDGNDNTLAEYDYDHLGRRIKKRYIESGNAVREVLYGYLGSSLAVAREWERFNDGGWGAWRLRREYLANQAVRLFIYSDDADTEADEILLFRYVYDLSLNVAAILDENGEIVQVDPEGRTSSESGFVSSTAAAMCLFEYDAFGNNLYRATPNRPNSEMSMRIAWNEIFPHHLAGKEWDTEARLYYFGYRWYDPQQGVFVSRTPLNPLYEETYAYCYNDPINFFDPNGYDPESNEAGVKIIMLRNPELERIMNMTPHDVISEVGDKIVDNLLAPAAEKLIRNFIRRDIIIAFQRRGLALGNEPVDADNEIRESAVIAATVALMIAEMYCPGGGSMEAETAALLAAERAAKFRRLKKLVGMWEKDRHGSIARSIYYHADEHWGGDVMAMLNSAARFNTKGATRKLYPLDPTMVRWEKGGKFLILREGKIVSHGFN